MPRKRIMGRRVSPEAQGCVHGDRVSQSLGRVPHVGPSPDWVPSFLSISAIQWLCNANKKSDIPAKRLYCFFSSLYSVLVSMRSPTCLGWLFIPPVDSDGVGSIPREGHSRRPARGRRTLWLFLSRSKP